LRAFCDSGQMSRPPTSWVSPRQRVESECARRGKAAVVADCVALLHGATDLELLRSLVGAGADKYFDGAEHQDVYWFRVWALRGLLWSWDASATDCVRRALSDESWRVREMAAKVVARHLVAAAFTVVTALRSDPVPRVRQAADRAVIRLTQANA
jgi:hypothetical protein